MTRILGITLQELNEQKQYIIKNDNENILKFSV